MSWYHTFISEKYFLYSILSKGNIFQNFDICFNNTCSILHKAPESVPTVNAERKSGNKKVACKILNQPKSEQICHSKFPFCSSWSLLPSWLFSFWAPLLVSFSNQVLRSQVWCVLDSIFIRRHLCHNPFRFSRFKISYYSADCDVGPWGAWTSCYLPPGLCGVGDKNRTR